jgi:hypothetical protein
MRTTETPLQFDEFGVLDHCPACDGDGGPCMLCRPDSMGVIPVETLKAASESLEGAARYVEGMTRYQPDAHIRRLGREMAACIRVMGAPLRREGAVSAISHLRGHPIYHDGEQWRYCDDGTPTVEGWRDRPCRKCGEDNTPEGHDACLGTLPGVANACCGHGDDESAYVQYEGGCHLTGAEAIAVFARLTDRSTPDCAACRSDRAGVAQGWAVLARTLAGGPRSSRQLRAVLSQLIDLLALIQADAGAAACLSPNEERRIREQLREEGFDVAPYRGADEVVFGGARVAREVER